MRCCAAWKPIETFFDPISFEGVDFQKLSQIIAKLTRDNLAEREAQIANFPWTQREKDNALARCRSGQRAWRNKKPVLSLSAVTDEEAIPWTTKMNQEEGFVSIGEPFLQARVEGPRHHQYEDIIRFVQKAPDDIRCTIDKTEFDELIAMKKDSAPGPDGIPYGAHRCAWCLGSQVLFNAYRSLLEGGTVPEHFAERVGLSLSPRPLTSMTMEGLFDLETHFVR